MNKVDSQDHDNDFMEIVRRFGIDDKKPSTRSDTQEIAMASGEKWDGYIDLEQGDDAETAHAIDDLHDMLKGVHSVLGDSITDVVDVGKSINEAKARAAIEILGDPRNVNERTADRLLMAALVTQAGVSGLAGHRDTYLPSLSAELSKAMNPKIGDNLAASGLNEVRALKQWATMHKRNFSLCLAALLAVLVSVNPWVLPDPAGKITSDLLQWIAASFAAFSCFKMASRGRSLPKKLWDHVRGRGKLRGGPSDEHSQKSMPPVEPSARRLSRSWWLLGGGALAWAGGQATWTWLEVVNGKNVPFPSYADVGFVIAVPLTILALLSFPTPQRTYSRPKIIFESLGIIVLLSLVTWVFVIDPIVEAKEGWYQFLSIFYPLGDVVSGGIALTALIQSRVRGFTPFKVMTVGIGLVACSDFLFMLAVEHNKYATASLLDLGWIVGFTLIGLAALSPTHEARSMAVIREAPLLRSAVPYIVIGIAALSLVTHLASQGRVTRYVIIGGLLSFAVIVIGQFRLSHHLAILNAELKDVRKDNSVTSTMTTIQNDVFDLRDMMSELVSARGDEDQIDRLVRNWNERADKVVGGVVLAATNAEVINDRLQELAERTVSSPVTFTYRVGTRWRHAAGRA